MNHPFFAQIVDSLSDALITVDQDKKIVIWNKMAETMFGYDRAEIERTGLEVIIPPPYLQRHQEGFDLFMNSVGSRDSFISEVREFEAVRKGGGVFPIELRHSIVKVSNREFYITAIIRDITPRRNFELMRDRFEHMTRHDLKNKLVIVCLAAERLAKTLYPDEKAPTRKYAEIILSESKGLIELLDSTKELVLLETGEYRRKDEEIDLADLLNLKTRQLRPMAAEKGVRINFEDRTNRKVILKADRSLLERSLENLLKNAVEAEEISNTVQMTLEVGQQGAPVLEVRNGGKPIPEKLQGSIFSPYVTHGKKGGVGLGLYSTRLILETIHGWQISFRSGPEGTTFKVIFGSGGN